MDISALPYPKVLRHTCPKGAPQAHAQEKSSGIGNRGFSAVIPANPTAPA